MNKLFFTIFVLIFNLTLLSQTAQQTEKDKRASTPVPYTLADRDRGIRLEMMLENQQKQLENQQKQLENQQGRIENIEQEIIQLKAKMEYQQSQINDIKNLIYVILSLIAILFGYIVWDRRTFMKPIEERTVKLETEMNLIVRKLDSIEQEIKQEEHKNKLEKMLMAFKELAKNNAEVASVLKQFNLL